LRSGVSVPSQVDLDLPVARYQHGQVITVGGADYAARQRIHLPDQRQQ